MYKGETIDDTLVRIAKQEVGLNINPRGKRLLGQFVGKFSTENNRQDISTCYVVTINETSSIIINKDHFTSYKIGRTTPQPIGAMYKYYLELYLQKCEC
jgi:ADP-ribose pyrophosphatase YjhB (NUDIX family)